MRISRSGLIPFRSATRAERGAVADEGQRGSDVLLDLPWLRPAVADHGAPLLPDDRGSCLPSYPCSTMTIGRLPGPFPDSPPTAPSMQWLGVLRTTDTPQ